MYRTYCMWSSIWHKHYTRRSQSYTRGYEKYKKIPYAVFIIIGFLLDPLYHVTPKYDNLSRVSFRQMPSTNWRLWELSAIISRRFNNMKKFCFQYVPPLWQLHTIYLAAWPHRRSWSGYITISVRKISFKVVRKIMAYAQITLDRISTPLWQYWPHPNSVIVLWYTVTLGLRKH